MIPGPPIVSVIVPTHSRRRWLNRCLGALVRQNLEPDAYEVIIVNDGADDGTRMLVQGWGDRARHRGGPAFRYLPIRSARGPAAARNVGWRAARGEIVAFTDDDCVPAADWLARGLEAFSALGVAAAAGRVIVPLSAR